MSTNRDEAIGYIAATTQAAQSANLPGVEWRLKLAEIEMVELRELVEKSGDDLHRAVALAWRAGFVCASIENNEVRQAFSVAREKSKSAGHWQTIYLMASNMGWDFPLDRDRKSVLKRIFMKETGLKERAFSTHYRRAEHHAMQFQADEKGPE